MASRPLLPRGTEVRRTARKGRLSRWGGVQLSFPAERTYPISSSSRLTAVSSLPVVS